MEMKITVVLSISNRLLQELLEKYIKCSQGFILFVSFVFYCHERLCKWSALLSQKLQGHVSKLSGGLISLKFCKFAIKTVQ